MISPWKYFTLDELKCKCGNCSSTGLEMKPDFMNKLVMLRESCGIPLIITSAYRCSAYNEKVSDTSINGPHTKGKAVDIKCFGNDSHLVLQKAMIVGFSGIGIKQKGLCEDRFIHLDTLIKEDGFPRPWTWSY